MKIAKGDVMNIAFFYFIWAR